MKLLKILDGLTLDPIAEALAKALDIEIPSFLTTDFCKGIIYLISLI